MGKMNALEASSGNVGNGTESVIACAPTVVIGLGRGGDGKSTLESELVWRAKAQGRDVIVGDFDPRSRTLSDLFPDAVRPKSEELPDVKASFLDLLNRVVRERRSAVIDFGAGDRFLADHGRDMRLVEFCRRRGVNLLALYVLGPSPESLKHCLSIWDAGYFRPERNLIAMNEGAIRDGQTVVGAFERTMGDVKFKAMVKDSGAKPFLVTRLACMEDVRDRGLGLYEAPSVLYDTDPTQGFMVEDWIDDIEAKRAALGVTGWLP